MIGGSILDTLSVRLIGDTSQFDASLKRAESTLTSFMGRIAGIGGSIHLNMGSVIKNFSEFDEAMTRSMTTMGLSGAGTRKALEEGIFKIAETSTIAPVKLADSLTILARQGLSAQESLQALAITEKFAVATSTDLEKATQGLLRAQNALGLQSSDTGKSMENLTILSDKIAKASQLGGANAEYFTHALAGRLGPAMRNLGISTEEGLATLAAFARESDDTAVASQRLAVMLGQLQTANTKGELAAMNHANAHVRFATLHKKGGTVDSALGHVAHQTITASQGWDKLGMSVFEKTASGGKGNFIGIAKTIEMLERRLAGASDHTKKLISEMLGLNERSKTGTDMTLGMALSIAMFTEEIKKAEGTVDGMSRSVLGSFSAQAKTLGNNLMIVAIQIGNILVPHLREMNEYLIKAYGYWKSLDPATKTVLVVGIASIGILATALITLGVVGMGISFAFGTLGTVLAVVFGSFAMIAMSPITLFLANLIGIIALVALALAGPEGLKKAWEFSLDFANRFVQTAIGFFYNFRENLKIIFDWIGENWRQLFADMANLFAIAIDHMIMKTLELGASVKKSSQEFLLGPKFMKAHNIGQEEIPTNVIKTADGRYFDKNTAMEVFPDKTTTLLDKMANYKSLSKPLGLNLNTDQARLSLEEFMKSSGLRKDKDVFPAMEPVNFGGTKAGDTFKEIDLSRFGLEGPGGLSRSQEVKKQKVEDLTVAEKLDRIILLMEKESPPLLTKFRGFPA